MFKNHSTILQLLFSVIIILIIVVWLFWKRNLLPPEVPFWYTRTWGQAQLAPKSYLLLLPGLAVVILIVNLALAKVFFRRERVLSQLLIVFSTLVSFLLGFAFWKIVGLVF